MKRNLCQSRTVVVGAGPVSGVGGASMGKLQAPALPSREVEVGEYLHERLGSHALFHQPYDVL